MRIILSLAVSISLSALPAFALEQDLSRLFSDLLKQHAPVEKPTVAVLPFACTAKDCPSGAGQSIAEYAVAFIMNQGAYKLVERMEFSKVAEELALSQTDMTDEKTILAAGKMLSASIVVTGTIGDALGKRMISVRMVKTETGEVLAASSITVESKALDDFRKDALGERTQVSATLFRSLLVPGWGQFYTGHPGQGVLFSASALASAGVLVWSLVDWNNKSDIASSLDRLPHAPSGYAGDESAWQDSVLIARKTARNDARRRTAMVGGITGFVWVANLIDAAIVGHREKRRVRELYFSATPGLPGLSVTIGF